MRLFALLALAALAACAPPPPAAAQEPIPWTQAIRPFEVHDLEGDVLPYPFAGGFIAPRPQLVDLDADGDADLVVNEGGRGLAYYERTPDGPTLGYAWRTDALMADGEAIVPGTWSVFGDLDGDGDLDLLTQGAPTRVRYYRNTGTPQSPQFTLAADELTGVGGGPVTNEDTSIPALTDVDGDGDLDFIHGQADRGHVTFWRHTGVQGGLPRFEHVTDDWEEIEVFEPNPSCEAPKPGAGGSGGGRGTLHGANALTLTDLDADGDLDFFWGDFFARSLWYFRNDGTAAEPDFTFISEVFPLDEPLTSGGYNVPTYGDADGDGDADLLIGILSGLCATIENRFDNLFFYENVGTAQASHYTLRSEHLIEGLDVGSRSNPALEDVDGDGDLDLVVGNDPLGLLGSQLTLFTNEGTPGAPALRLTDPDWLSIVYDFGAYAPTFADLDGDGDRDLVVGGFNGRLAYLERTGPGLGDFALRDEAWQGVDVGQYIHPAFGDLDGDGDLDLVTGESNGMVKVYRNVGSATEPAFLTEPNGAPVAADLEWRDAVGIPADIGFDSAPALTDLDGDGDLDLVVGTAEGPLRVYRNVGTATEPDYVEEEAVPAHRPITTPALGDLDGDGDPDLVAGNRSGGLLFFSYGTFTTGLGDAGPPEAPAPTLEAVPNPSTGHVTFRLGAPVRPGAPAALVVYDARGREVARVPVPAGEEAAAWAPPTSAASGVYLARLEADGVVLAAASFTRLR
ncbi:MAG TPA: FG-GAP-like repeat-containing protein [Rubricoccaceae bacterium]|nr:FG-GAP-like repeat-containing protein [Rubricoccaceae bacterium]